MKKLIHLFNIILLLLGMCLITQSCTTPNEDSGVEVAALEIESIEEQTTGEEMEGAYQKLVIPIIEYVETGNKIALSEHIAFPLKRDYPIPAIHHEGEFLERYDEIFDAELIEEISNSNPATDWSDVGWRGIMLSYGSVWIDYDGNIIAINHQSEVEKAMKKRLIKEERNALHKSIQSYKRPVLIMETKKFRVRIDELEDTYRYASWSLPQEKGEKPDLVITGGKVIREGNAGNRRYEFINNGYLYKCSIIVLGEGDHPPAELMISKGDEDILYQEAKVISR